MREIVFDTETTGFDFPSGDRLVEIGCVELFNRVETGRTFHAYFHPERGIPAEAQAVHGLSDAFLSDKPLFGHRVADLLAFVGDDTPLIAHNASFDFAFLNGEIGRCGHDPVCLSRMVDTLQIARTRHPGAKHSLDALCNRFGIDRSHRVQHGALLDAHLLAQVYVELMGGRQIGLGLVSSAAATVGSSASQRTVPARIVRPPRHFAPGAGDLVRHAAFMKGIADPIWGVKASG
jgi:DNA polymerase-3 subunit epsilon